MECYSQVKFFDSFNHFLYNHKSCQRPEMDQFQVGAGEGEPIFCDENRWYPGAANIAGSSAYEWWTVQNFPLLGETTLWYLPQVKKILLLQLPCPSSLHQRPHTQTGAPSQGWRCQTPWRGGGQVHCSPREAGVSHQCWYPHLPQLSRLQGGEGTAGLSRAREQNFGTTETQRRWRQYSIPLR